MRVQNENDVPVEVAIDSAYGTKSSAVIAPGASMSRIFSTRQAAIPDGSVSAVLSGEVNGRTVATEKEILYPGKTC